MNIAQVDPLALPSLPLAERSQLPKCSGIYFVIKDGDILYVGRTANLYQRWLAHHIWQHLYGVSGELRVAWLECSDTELLPAVEKAMIVHFKPLLNKCSGASQRLNAILPDNVYEELLMLAETEKRTKSQMAALLIEEAIATRKAQENEAPLPKKDKGAA
ncbi:hypothetical protein SD81_028490 [Tolypothrix campylonemoides VB511288]|nr:hypothetical protein SD81_028490 [Tolypothrix campylonemoides VB511288]